MLAATVYGCGVSFRCVVFSAMTDAFLVERCITLDTLRLPLRAESLSRTLRSFLFQRKQFRYHHHLIYHLSKTVLFRDIKQHVRKRLVSVLYVRLYFLQYAQLSFRKDIELLLRLLSLYFYLKRSFRLLIIKTAELVE